MELRYRVAYEGGVADENRLPAHQGATSLEGLSWTYSLIANYAATGKIRSRGDLSRKIQVYILPARQGSFVNDFVLFITEPNNLFLTSLLGSYAVATVGQVVNSLVVSTIKEVSGLVKGLSQTDESRLMKLPSGDREALVDKIEPSMKRAHIVIGEGVDSISIKKGQSQLITLGYETKEYVNADFIGDELVKTVSVGAFNANSGNGRFYLADIGKTVPFFVDKGSDNRTYSLLSKSLDDYVNGKNGNIDVVCKEILANDRRIKKLIVDRAYKPIS